MYTPLESLVRQEHLPWFSIMSTTPLQNSNFTGAEGWGLPRAAESMSE